MKKNKVTIQFEVNHGPIYLSYYEEGYLFTDSEIVNESTKIIKLNRKLGQIYNSWYSFDEYGIPVDFNKEKQQKEANIVLSLLEQMIEEITLLDKNILIEDNETKFYKKIVDNKTQK